MKSLLNKRIAIFGAGAVGSYLGSKLVEHGFTDVEFVARSGYNVLKENGLTVKNYTDKSPYNVKVNACKELSGLYDAVLICVKSKDTVTAAKQAADHLKDDGFVVSIQNGVENPDIISAFIPADKIITNVIYMTAVMQEKGVLEYMAEGRLIFGHLNGQSSKYTETYMQILQQAGLNAKYTDNIKHYQWQKLMLNIVLNPLTALFRKTFYKMSKYDDALSLTKSLFKEAQNAAKLCGVDIADEEYDKITARCKENVTFKSSMYQDIEANRNPEIDAILGVVVRTHEKHNQSAPYCDCLLKIMNVKYGGWFQISPTLAADVLVINNDKVLLIDRKNEPLGWAIPGGLVDLYETMESAALRELQEETGIKADIKDLHLLGIYSDPKRDSRGHTVSAVYVYFSDKEAHAADDARDAKYFHIDNLPEKIAFDHRKILRVAKEKFMK